MLIKEKPVVEYNIVKSTEGAEMETIRSLLIGTNREVYALRKYLIDHDINCTVALGSEEIFRDIAEQSPHVVLIELGSQYSRRHELAEIIKKEKALPVIALLPRNALQNKDIGRYFDDFITEPYSGEELIFRMHRLTNGGGISRESEGNEIIQAGDLLINLAKCEVTLKGRVILLAFKEYELLKFLASNPGRVFTRQMLLDKVWGYDYFGGDRTVDVHIRRLRSKIEDSTHSFIETVRSIGYRFREDI